MINFLLWITFGALAGWVASLVFRSGQDQSFSGNILAGLLGALLGGSTAIALYGNTIASFRLDGFFLAAFGAIIVIIAFNTLTSGRSFR